MALKRKVKKESVLVRKQEPVLVKKSVLVKKKTQPSVLVRKAKTPPPKPVPVRNQTYGGPLSQVTTYRDGLVLVHIDDAPDDSHFVPVNRLGVPPDTYYAFDMKAQKIVHMVSKIVETHYAWDSDRDGRYFTRSGRLLLCPRYIEYCYDSDIAISKGEVWDIRHPNYKGTLSGRPDMPGHYRDHTTPALRRKQREAVKNTLVKKHGQEAVGTLGNPRKKILQPKQAVQDDGILTRTGLDETKLKSAAQSLAEKYDAAFGDSKTKQPKNVLRRKK